MATHIIGHQTTIKRKAFFAALVFGFLTICSVCKVNAAFQESLWGARPAGLAGAYTALSDDANAPAYNPSGISLIAQSEVTFMYARLFSGVNFYAGEDTSRLGLGYFSWAPNIANKRYGSYAISWSNFAATNLYREDTLTLTAADSYQFDKVANAPILSYGLNLKFLRRSFSTDSRTSSDPVFSGGRDSNAITGDLGLIFRPNWTSLPGLRFGAAGQNLTEPDIGLQTTDRVPMRLSFGMAYQDKAMPLIGPSVEVSRRNSRTLVTGAWEAWLAREVLAFRVGANADELGSGIGYQFKLTNKMQMRLDYAIIWPFNVDGTNGSHRVSISAAF